MEMKYQTPDATLNFEGSKFFRAEWEKVGERQRERERERERERKRE